jgi:imidazoleglycerol-phosphate dehydratase
MANPYIEIENITLDDGESKIEFLPKESLNSRYTNDLEHMVKQLFTHSRIGGNVRVHLENCKSKGLWGYSGRELGKFIGAPLQSRENTYGQAVSIVSFEDALSVVGVKFSGIPATKINLMVPDDEYKILVPEVKEFLGNFSTESNIDIQSVSFPIKTFFDLQNNDMKCVQPTDGHHVIESLFKSFAYALHLAKSQKNKPISCKLPEHRQRTVSRERNTHETQISLLLNLDGQGKYENSNLEVRVPSETIDAFEYFQSCLTAGSGFDQIFEKKLLGDEEHHFMEDYGIIQGEALLESLGDKKGILRFGYDIQECPKCGERVIIAADLPGTNRSRLTASLYDVPSWRRQYLILHYLISLTRSGGIDAFIGQYLKPENIEKLLGDAGYTTFMSLVNPNSEYHLPANSIKGSYSLETTCDSPYHRDELLMAALGRSLKQSTSIDRVKKNYVPTTKGELK